MPGTDTKTGQRTNRDSKGGKDAICIECKGIGIYR
jgi:hypothetical protein